MRNVNLYIEENVNSISKISKKTGIEIDKLELLRTAQTLPSYSELKSLSLFFRVPVSFLMESVKEIRDSKLLFRKSNDQKINSLGYDKISSFISDIKKFDFNKVNYASIREKLNSRQNNFLDGEILASQFRLLYFDDEQKSPINNLPEILAKKAGCIIKVFELGKDIDGASAYVDDMVFLFVSPRFEGRMLFTLAHELAHIINHRETEDFLYIDSKISFDLKKLKTQQELFANSFASSLLLPIKGILLLIRKIRELNNIPANDPIGDVEILYVARFYGVSFDVASYRFEILGLMPEGATYSVSKKIKQSYGSAEKRAELLGLPSREKFDFNVFPDYLVQGILEKIDNGSCSTGKVSEILGISIQDLLNLNIAFGRNN